MEKKGRGEAIERKRTGLGWRLNCTNSWTACWLMFGTNALEPFLLSVAGPLMVSGKVGHLVEDEDM